MLFDVDWRGAQQLGERAQDADDVVAGCMARAPIEISHWPEYDYVIVNDDLDTSVRAILRSEHLRRTRQQGLIDFAGTLIGRT